MVRKIIGKIIYRILKLFIPEIAILKSDLTWSLLDKNISYTHLGENIKINVPAQITNSTIGDYTYIASNSRIYQTTIGKFGSIGPNFISGIGIHPTNGISTAPMFYSTLKQNGMTLSVNDKIKELKPIKIGNDVFIGANVTVLDGVSIGDGAVIGAGAVVSKDIPPYAIAIGCPIRILKYRFSEKQIESVLKIKWWEFSQDKLLDVEKYFFEIEEFIKKHET